MAQPPANPLMTRELSRSVPFVTPRTFVQQLANAASVSAEFDCLAAVADTNLFQQTGAYPGTDTPKLRAVGPWLDAAVYATGATQLLVEYAVDRGCGYRAVSAPVAIAGTVFYNISGLRITGRFVRVTLTNTSGAACNIEFGVYVRST